MRKGSADALEEAKSDFDSRHYFCTRLVFTCRATIKIDLQVIIPELGHGATSLGGEACVEAVFLVLASI